MASEDIRLSDEICGNFTIEEVLWILFSSGVVNNSTVQPFEGVKAKIVGNGFNIERIVDFGEIPCYINDLLIENMMN